MDAEDFQPAVKETIEASNIFGIADIFVGEDPFPRANAIAVLNIPITDGSLFLDAAGSWATRLRLDQIESNELRATAKTIWLLWGDAPAQALEEFKVRLGRARRRALIQQATKKLGGESQFAMRIFQCLADRFGLTSDFLVAELIQWFHGPDDSYMPDFGSNVTAATKHVMSPDNIGTALGVALLSEMIEGATYEIQQNVELRLLGIIFDQIKDRYFSALEVPLPPFIHFYWVKGDMTTAAVSNLCAWAQCAKGTDWQVYLWTDKAITPCLKQVGPTLSKAGVQLQEIGSMIDPRLSACYQEALGFSLPAAADLARLSVLRKFGGIYCDVDMAPGQLNLTKLQPTLSPMGVPLFAPGVRDISSIRVILDLPSSAVVTDADIKRAVQQQTSDGEFNNGFIVIPKNCLFMEPMINDIARRAASIKGEAWRGDTASAATGPMAIGPVLRHIVAIRDVLTTERARDAVASQVVCKWPLQWLTPESENQ